MKDQILWIQILCVIIKFYVSKIITWALLSNQYCTKYSLFRYRFVIVIKKNIVGKNWRIHMGVWNKRILFYLNNMRKKFQVQTIFFLLFLQCFCNSHVSLLILYSSKWIFRECNIFASNADNYDEKTLCKFSGGLRDGTWDARGIPDRIRFKALLKWFTRHGSKALTGNNDNEIKLHVRHKSMQLRNEAPRCRDASTKTSAENEIRAAWRRQTRISLL